MIRVEDIPVAIPAFQAASAVGGVVRRALQIVNHVLVVDDGSTDRTAEVAAQAGARVVLHPCNLGKGRALRTAFADLFGRDFEFVVTLDADGQHRPEDIPGLVDALEFEADLVIGDRDHLFSQMGVVRRTSNRCSSHLISSLAGRTLSDVQSGFRIYSRRLIECTGFPEPRFEAESAVVVRGMRLGFRIRTVPIELGFVDGRPTSHYRPIVDSLRIAAAVTRARLETMGWQPQSHS